MSYLPAFFFILVILVSFDVKALFGPGEEFLREHFADTDDLFMLHRMHFFDRTLCVFDSIALCIIPDLHRREAMVSLLILYGTASSGFTYLVTFLFRNASTGQVRTHFSHLD